MKLVFPSIVSGLVTVGIFLWSRRGLVRNNVRFILIGVPLACLAQYLIVYLLDNLFFWPSWWLVTIFQRALAPIMEFSVIPGTFSRDFLIHTVGGVLIYTALGQGRLLL